MQSGIGLGFRVHSGWAALIALGGKPAFPEMIHRARLALLDREGECVAQPYHAAAEMELADAEEYIARSADSSTAAAREQLEALLVTLRAKDRGVAGCGILFASGRQAGALASTLASHCRRGAHLPAPPLCEECQDGPDGVRQERAAADCG